MNQGTGKVEIHTGPFKKKPMGDLISSDIQLTQEEYDLIHEALNAYRKRCRANAHNAMNNGYGPGNTTVTSQMKAEVWEEKAEFCDAINSKLGQAFI